jgi:sigma-B regulation protein RsbU (phosphoserine phosphatase)
MSSNPIRILLIEDNPGDRRLIQELLAEGSTARFDLAFADRLSTGLKLLASEKLDLLLLDLDLPDSQGLKTFHIVHEKAGRIPILIFSGVDDEDLAIQAVHDGAQDYLVKGHVNSNLLAREIRHAIERKSMEERMRILEQMATIGNITSMVGHDMRNPLQVLTNIFYIAKERIKNIPPEMMDKIRGGLSENFIEIAEDQISYMNKIVSDLQDYSSSLKPRYSKMNSRELLERSLLKIIIPENIKVTIDVSQNTEEVFVDTFLLTRILINIIINAVQAMPNGGQLAMGVFHEKGSLLISIQDTGIGIKPENMDKIFQPMFTTKAKGQGLGLAVCKRLVEAMEGTILVESKPNIGTTVTIRMPLKEPKEE